LQSATLLALEWIVPVRARLQLSASHVLAADVVSARRLTEAKMDENFIVKLL